MKKGREKGGKEEKKKRVRGGGDYSGWPEYIPLKLNEVAGLELILVL